MGRSSPGDNDHLYGGESRGNRQLDPLHPSQEGSSLMVGRTSLTYKDGISSQQLKIVVFLGLISLAETTVRIETPDPYLFVPEHTDVNLTCLFSDDQGAELRDVHVKWRRRDQDRIITEGVTTVWDATQQKGYTVLQVPEVSKTVEGTYMCVVWIQRSFDYGYVEIHMINTTREIMTKVQVIPPRKTRHVRDLQIPNREIEQENLIVGLIRDFGKVQNVTKITACLPMPHAAGDPIPWGIIPVPEIPKMFKNITRNCKFVTITWSETVDVCLLSDKMMKKQCEQMPGYFRWVVIGTWVTSETINELKGYCLVTNSTHPCSKVPASVKREKQEEVCQNITSSTTMEEWQTIWGPSLLETYSYIGKVQWCIHWKGKKNQTYSTGNRGNHNWRTETHTKEDWNCTRIYTCDTPDDEIGLMPVKALLQLGCECQGYNHTIKGHVKNIDCHTTTVRSPGNLVWVMGHGQWTTHMPLDGPVVPVTLGIPTLCPLWRKEKLTPAEMRPREKREVSNDINDLELTDWHEPSAGVKFGWALESLFAPISTYRNREILFKLMSQTERLAAVTKKGFKDLNLQLQATSRMTIQNRMALDLILLKEHGVCGYLHAKDEHCCVHIPNVTQEVEKDINQLEQIDENVHKLQKEAEHNWIGQLFSSLGLHVSGWISSVIQYGILIVIIVVIAITVYKCLLGMIVKEGQHTRRIMKAITRKEVISPQNGSPPIHQETAT
ncbi:uncharacterized protein LOC127462093 isoform X3 [Manacus candei]|uniref:uncharacterized protein LOC127462093 isoform X2 n=1 Tax=Manacus candei TaxID=415023 RepID=UPI0022277A8B|nr:uncharacterized protein LOC127462093 isoform X2 [Manacus candei]XP_051626598.1 uncharacterized protein LOC127462093 isoform X3 [Manacus candei]XP_051626664.1 uncharacterized protein LOC127462093 isoform X3 [Manacus candei]